MMLQTCLPTENQALSDQSLWCAIQTFSRCEQAVADLLTARGVECYFPVETVRRIVRGKPQHVTRAFYEGYLFASYRGEHERHEIRRTRYVGDLLTAYGHRQERLAWEIESLKRVLEVDPLADATPWAERGRWVRVTSGPLTGITGEIIRRCRRVKGKTVTKDLLCVGVTMLGRVVEMEVDPGLCEPA